MVAAPGPDERVGQSLVKDAAIAMAGSEGENESVVVTLCFERRRGSLAGHHPVVMSVLRIVRAIIVFGDVGEDAQRLFLTVFDQLHAGVIFPRAERIFDFLGRVVVLLIDEGAGIADEATE